MTRPKKLTPYLECNIGGSLAAAKETNGGFYLSPSVGAQVKLTQKLKMNIALSYEIQQLETLKQRTDEYFHTEFKEELSHHSITLKVGQEPARKQMAAQLSRILKQMKKRAYLGREPIQCLRWSIRN